MVGFQTESSFGQQMPQIRLHIFQQHIVLFSGNSQQ